MPYAVKFCASFFSLFLAGCSAATPPPRDDLLERYKQFTARHLARLDEAGITSECINKHRKMLGAAILTGDTETQGLASEGLKNCPPINGLRSGETIDDYLDRLIDQLETIRLYVSSGLRRENLWRIRKSTPRVLEGSGVKENQTRAPEI